MVSVFINVCFNLLCSYGQTGTGKTFTMEGERSPDEQFTWEEVRSVNACVEDLNPSCSSTAGH